MNNIFKITIFALALFYINSCSTQSEYKIDFCLNFGENDECVYEKAEFPLHQRVFVKFSAEKTLSDSLYIGNISVKQKDGKYESLGFKEFRPEEPTTYLKHHIPFDVFGGFGTYLVEFKNSKEEVLAKREIHFATEQ